MVGDRVKKKNKIIILIATLLIILSLFFLYYVFFNHKDTLSISEKQWIDNNKNDIIDISVLNDVPAFTYNGNGVLFDFLNYISKETNLSFNPSAFRIADTDLNDYSFTLKNKKDKNDLLVYRDNYVLVNLDGSVINDLSEINNYNIGIVTENLEKFKKYFNDTNVYTEYSSTSEALNNDGNVNALILLKSDVMQYLCEKKLSISYQFLSETKDYVLTLNGDNTLNSILTKYFNKWYKTYYKDSYNEHLLNDYYEYNNITTLKQTDLKSKTYVYGFVEDGIYDILHKGNLTGINNSILKSYTNFSNVEIKFKKYSSINKLVNDFENGKIDIMLNNNDINIKKDSYLTKSFINSKLVVLSSYDKVVSIDNIYDLRNYKVATVKNSKIAKVLQDNDIKYDGYNNIDTLLKRIQPDQVVVIDLENYNFYKTRNFKNYKLDLLMNDINYNFIINNSSINSVFASLFDFYTNYSDLNTIIETNYSSISYKTVDYFYVMLIVIIIVVIILIITIINKVRLVIKKIRNERRSTLTKEEKLKYIDQLTSLKNRAYLNSKVEEWDESEVYPQCILVVDLNNIAYINDNYGREEGDKIILQAANILIMSQLPNTEIIRTDGNEFLVYLVGYPEKTIIAYQRKLSRAFKNLDHGFGAASGYSMITDAIKTFDDAVNEATIDMRNNKDGN